MKNLRVWKIIAGLTVIFALGGVSGAAWTARNTGWGRMGRLQATDAWSERWFAQMGERLELREEQVKALRPMVGQLQNQLRDLQKETAHRTSEIIRQNGRQMWEVLDAAQREKYRKLEDRQKLHRAATAPASP